MDRYKNYSSSRKDMPGLKNKTEKLGSFTKGPSGMTNTSTTKKTSFSMSSNSNHLFYEKPKFDRNPSDALYKKKDQNLTKPVSSSVTSYNNSKQLPTKNEFKIAKPKQDQIQLGVPYKGEQNLATKVSNFPSNYKEQKPSYSSFNVPKSKENGRSKPEPIFTKPYISASQSRDDRKHSKTLNYSQDNKNNESREREKFVADYTANLALLRTMKQMWQSPKKGKDANPLKSSSYVASESKSLKYKTDEGAHSLWKEQAPGQVKNSVPENFLPIGQSKSDVKVNETIGTETFKSNQSSFENVILKGEIPKDVREEELQLYLLKEPALTALYAGLPADLIKQAIKEKLKQTGTSFTSARELIEAVSKLKKESLETQKRNNKAEDTVVGKQEENVADRKMLEEIKMLKQEKMCKICLDGEVGIVFVPCGHLVTCVKCSENIKTCPLCRAEIQSTVKTFLS